MSRNFRQSWYRAPKKRSRKSAFGGKVASHQEVEALNQKIEAHEAEEFEDFEKNFDQQLKNL